MIGQRIRRLTGETPDPFGFAYETWPQRSHRSLSRACWATKPGGSAPARAALPLSIANRRWFPSESSPILLPRGRGQEDRCRCGPSYSWKKPPIPRSGTSWAATRALRPPQSGTGAPRSRRPFCGPASVVPWLRSRGSDFSQGVCGIHGGPFPKFVESRQKSTHPPVRGGCSFSAFSATVGNDGRAGGCIPVPAPAFFG